MRGKLAKQLRKEATKIAGSSVSKKAKDRKGQVKWEDGSKERVYKNLKKGRQ